MIATSTSWLAVGSSVGMEGIDDRHGNSIAILGGRVSWQVEAVRRRSTYKPAALSDERVQMKAWVSDRHFIGCASNEGEDETGVRSRRGTAIHLVLFALQAMGFVDLVSLNSHSSTDRTQRMADESSVCSALCAI